jgi:integrase
MLELNGKTTLVKGVIKMRGDGYLIRGGMLYVDGEVDGRRYRRSTGLVISRKNISYVKKYHAKILREFVEEDRRYTFSSFSLEVIENGRCGRSEAYHAELLGKFKKDIEPHFKDIDFAHIKPLDIERWQNKLFKKYSRNSVAKYTNLLRNIMIKAVANDLCAKNPFLGVDKIRNKKGKKREIYTEEEIKRLIDNATGWFKVFLITAFGTAMRTGELLALKWDDINFSEQTIAVRRSINHGRIKESTKTGVARKIDMLEIVQESLTSLYKEKRNEWVFPNQYGKPYSEGSNITKYYFKPLLEKLGIKYKTLYASRHSFISLMLNKGMDLMWVQMMAGHASSATTLKYYAVFEKANKNRLKIANNILNNGTIKMCGSSI